MPSMMARVSLNDGFSYLLQAMHLVKHCNTCRYGEIYFSKFAFLLLPKVRPCRLHKFIYNFPQSMMLTFRS
jgi:hypothetical protein